LLSVAEAGDETVPLLWIFQQEMSAGIAGSSYVVGDLTAKGTCKAVVDSAVASLGGLTTVVNCAGVLQGGAFGTPACNLDNFDFNFGINVRAVSRSDFLLSKCFEGFPSGRLSPSSIVNLLVFLRLAIVAFPIFFQQFYTKRVPAHI
jgi:NAD(P)-dependent dehydrogenase (short-subunit alcohol dehydrogenase family)